jgi:hypothetical protein
MPQTAARSPQKLHAAPPRANVALERCESENCRCVQCKVHALAAMPLTVVVGEAKTVEYCELRGAAVRLAITCELFICLMG